MKMKLTDAVEKEEGKPQDCYLKKKKKRVFYMAGFFKFWLSQ